MLKRDHGQKPHTTAVTVERESVILLHFDHLDTKNSQKDKGCFRPPERVLWAVYFKSKTIKGFLLQEIKPIKQAKKVFKKWSQKQDIFYVKLNIKKW